MIERRDEGVVYRNPRPDLRARHTWHPTVVRFDDGELVVAFDIAQADAAFDYRTYSSRSLDGGATWSEPQRVFPDPPGRPTTHSVRISRTGDDELVAWGSVAYRDDPERGLVNPETLGYAEMDLVLLRSADRGRTWLGPERIEPPLVGPSFETCHAIVVTRDGRWLGPTSTWPGWDGDDPNGMNAILLVSSDRGRTWPSHIVEFDRWSERVAHWEQSFLELRDGRWLAVAWALDTTTGRTLPTPYAIARDGAGFDHHGQTGFLAQTTKLVELPDGRILAAYRRDDEAGLWATLARLEGDDWVNVETVPLWRGQPSGMAGAAAPGAELAQLRFGFPQMVLEPGGTVLLVFWCEEEGIKNIRWQRLDVA